MPVVVIAFGLLAGTALLGQGAQRGSDAIRQLMDTRPERGQNVAPVFEGWQRNADGTFDLHFGYLNRNWSEAVDIPVGASNAFEPGPPDRGQPTHFLARRHKQIFRVTVPSDFGKQTLVWTLSDRGHAEKVSGSLRPEQQIDVSKDTATGNAPPKVEIAAAGAVRAGVPFKLVASVMDDGLPKTRASAENVRLGLNVSWSKYRGPGSLRFEPAVTAVQAQTAATTVVFSEPGDYMVQALADDGSVLATAQGQNTPGFACCWSTTRVKVTVTGPGTTGRAGSASAYAQQGARVPTFARDIAPVFQAKCQSCHRPGTVAPMSLLTYEQARPWARSIRDRVLRREMPPWHLDANVGIKSYKNDVSLTDHEIATIAAWVDNGAPLGDPKDLPAPITFNDDEWTIGKPDLIISLTEADVVAAAGPDWWVNRVVETGLTEDRYIKAVETRVNAEGRQVVHHAIATLLQDDADRSLRRGGGVDSGPPILDVDEGTYLSEYAVGKNGEAFPDGAGRVIKAGAKVRFNMHYSSAAGLGREVPAVTSVGFVFYPKGYKPKYFITDLFPHENDSIDIAPGQMARTDVYYSLPQPARIVGFQPHMHMRGKAMCMEAIYPEGRREMLSCVDRWDFSWHIMYTYTDDVMPLLPAGTMLHLIAIHDNTKSNPRNPDPTVWVGWGQRSIDDMAAAHINTQFLTQEDFDRLVAERKAAQGRPLSNIQPRR